MPTALEPREDDYAEKVAEVQAFGSWIEAAVNFDRTKTGIGTYGPEILVGDGLDEAALLEDIDDVGGLGRGIQAPVQCFQSLMGGMRGAAPEMKGQTPLVGRREGEGSGPF